MTAATPTRVVWVDTAKAVSIVSVVLFHASSLASGNAEAEAGWRMAALAVYSFMLPLFFLVSGLFTGPSSAVSFGSYARRRVAPLVWVFAVWTVVYTLLDAATESRVGGSLADNLALRSILWFLPGLAIHMLIARALVRVPAAFQLGVAAIISLPVAQFFPFDGWGLAHTAQYLVFFLAGSLWRTRIVEFVDRARPSTCVTLGVIALVVGSVAVTVPVVGPLAYGLLPVVTVPLVLVGSKLVGRWCAVASVGRYIGSRTLAVLVVHPLVIQVVSLVVGTPAGLLTGAVLPVATMLAALAASFVVQATAGRIPGVLTMPGISRYASVARSVSTRRRTARMR
ncbi:acyltransferase family protein [Rhodococcus kroppenstedtii]|uniref:acyltransferase family protein n=1 Tax=Rhodococcoides kroppenstedtii TaxID=293050 RepID=UPI001C9AFD39|nr:acyltransferase family protein [Rhodococcus kroppenstedtii]MBY6437556.1 acyltransferase family protein [Rhodococcus kroppenstedtii]